MQNNKELPEPISNMLMRIDGDVENYKNFFFKLSRETQEIIETHPHLLFFYWMVNYPYDYPPEIFNIVEEINSCPICFSWFRNDLQIYDKLKNILLLKEFLLKLPKYKEILEKWGVKKKSTLVEELEDLRERGVETVEIEHGKVSLGYPLAAASNSHVIRQELIVLVNGKKYQLNWLPGTERLVVKEIKSESNS